MKMTIIKRILGIVIIFTVLYGLSLFVTRNDVKIQDNWYEFSFYLALTMLVLGAIAAGILKVLDWCFGR